MKRLLTSLFLLSLLSCGQTNTHTKENNEISMGPYKIFDKSNHLQPSYDKKQFDTLHSWDFGWSILETINIAQGDTEEITLATKFLPGQKALYFIWHLDAEVTNGGFIQFYWNDYKKYIPPIIDGLKLIGDNSMIDLVQKADKEYLDHKKEFTSQRQKDDWKPLYDNLKRFNDFDSVYYATRDKTMELLEIYARKKPEEFVKFK